MHFCKKILDRNFKLKRIQKWIFHFFTKQLSPGSFRSWCAKGIKKSTSRVEFLVPLTHHDPKDLDGLICLVKERQNLFLDSSGLKNPIFNFLQDTVTCLAAQIRFICKKCVDLYTCKTSEVFNLRGFKVTWWPYKIILH